MGREIDRSGLLRRYGTSSLSYSTVAPRLSIYTHEGVEGYVAFKRSGKTLLALGDPVCAEGDVKGLVEGFIAHGSSLGARPVLFAATGRYSQQYKELGLRGLRVARDSVLDVTRFTLKGNRMMNVRRGYNRANNVGLQFMEYKPQEVRDRDLEEQCIEISKHWLKGKGMPELDFILWRLDWDAVGDRRFFVAMTEERVEGFLAFEPVYPRDWYMDMSRRRDDSPNGTTDFLVVNSIEAFRGEGCERLYLGMVPNLDFTDEVKDSGAFTIWVLGFISRHFDRFYPASSESFFKNKYRPVWEDLYLYLDGPVTLALMRDVFKACQPKGLIRSLL